MTLKTFVGNSLNILAWKSEEVCEKFLGQKYKRQKRTLQMEFNAAKRFYSHFCPELLHYVEKMFSQKFQLKLYLKLSKTWKLLAIIQIRTVACHFCHF